MLEIKYKSYNTMPISVYNKLIDVYNNKQDDYNKHFNTIAILADKKIDDIMNLPLEELNGINSELNFLNNFSYNDKAKFGKTIEINGNTYTIAKPENGLSVAQYVDFQQYTSQDKPDLASILSTLLVPKGKTYNKDYDVFELIEEISNNLDIVTALELQNFITKKCENFIRHILHYLHIQTKLMKMIPTTKSKKKEMLNQIKEISSKLGSV